MHLDTKHGNGPPALYSESTLPTRGVLVSLFMGIKRPLRNSVVGAERPGGVVGGTPPGDRGFELNRCLQ